MTDPATVRIATWNLWWRHGPWELRQSAILAALRSVAPDVIGLQEVSFVDPDHPAMLADGLDWHVVTSPSASADTAVGRVMGNAVASRWPILDSDWAWLHVGAAPLHRTVLWARIDAPFGEFDMVTTHLSHGFDQSALRCRQLAEVAAFVAAHRRTDDLFPPVLTGDLNAVPDSDEIRAMTGRSAPPVPGLVFTDVWSQVGEGSGETWSGANPHVIDSAWPDRRLDYIAVAWPRPRPAGNPVAARRFGVDADISGMVASDHYGVFADLSTPRAQPAAMIS